MRQFPQEDDDIDYDALRQSRAEDRASIKEIRDSLKIDENDLMAKLAAAAAHATPDQVRAAQARATITRSGVTRHGSAAPVQQPAFLPPSIQHTASVTKYAEVVDALDRFAFSNEPERRKRQMKIVANALRTALQELVLEEVALNTKTAFKGYAHKVVKAPGGLKVYFNFGDGRAFTVVAKGGFCGDETVCVHQTDGKVRAAVLRFEGEDYTDLSNHFDVSIARTKGDE